VCVSSASTGPCGGQRVNRCPYRDRRIVNPPAALGRARRDLHHCLRLCRYAGPDGIQRPGPEGTPKSALFASWSAPVLT
jgi:hypothetical protein